MEVLPRSVRDEVLRVVASVYETWGPHIKEQVAAAGERSAQAAAQTPESSRAGMGWFVGCAIWVVGFFTVGSLVPAARGEGVFILFVVAGIVSGVVAARRLRASDRDRQVAKARNEAVEKALKVEHKLSNELGLTEKLFLTVVNS